MKKRCAYALIAGLLVCFFFLDAAKGSPGPKTVVPEPTHDAEKIKAGEVITHAFRIRNEGDQVLRIKAVKPG